MDENNLTLSFQLMMNQSIVITSSMVNFTSSFFLLLLKPDSIKTILSDRLFVYNSGIIFCTSVFAVLIRHQNRID